MTASSGTRQPPEPDTGQAAGIGFDLLDLAFGDGDTARVKLLALLAGRCGTVC